MGEIKSVKVDNWGVFFLQKLQNFFNKTDYCDLTLQFRDNSQLKVHRLVLSACTDYFNVLEQTCEMVDDALIMPNELQADVVVPIVNFMYTGTLEFELKMYGRLLRTAKEMNMTVLLKLLEAHRRTMEGVNKAQRPPSPKTIRRRGPPPAAGSATAQQVQQQRRILTANNVSPQRRGGIQVSTGATGQKVVTYRQQIGSTAVTRTTTVKQDAHAGEEGGQKTTTTTTTTSSSSPFEQLRRGYNNTKRPASTSFVSPPAKKPNIEDVKEFAEQQRMRKQIAAEYGEDPEFESMLDDDIHDDNDDDEDVSGATEHNSGSRSVGTTASTHTLTSSSATAGQRQKSQQQQQQQHEQATITIKQGVGDQPATIIVKDSSNSKMNHAKIISEVLRQYPHLVKGNKNIKLKIMPNSSLSSQKVLIKKEDSSPNSSTEGLTETEAVQRIIQKQQPEVTIKKIQSTTTTATKSSTQNQDKKAQTATATTTGTAAAATTSSGATQKRRIDSKTMHALIALGAENTAGPWLCLRCGVNGRPISIPSYRGFRRHLINTHKEKIDAALCEHCGWRSSNKRELHFHTEQEHKVKSTLFTFPDCLLCSVAFIDSNALSQHMQESHANEEKQQCIYCNKIFGKELQLYQHMRSYHKKQAIQDGIIDYEDEEYLEEVLTLKDKEAEKVKILSDISLPVKLEQHPSSEAHALSTVASGIAASIGINNSSGTEEYIQAIQTDTATGGVETKFINADGNEMVLTEEQRKEIMSQLNQDNVGGTVMVLQGDEAAAVAALQQQQDDVEHEEHDEEAGKSSQDESHETEEEEYDDSQIYNELATDQQQHQQQQQQQTIEEEKLLEKQNTDESTTDGGLEWAENLLSAHEDMEEEAAAKPKETILATTTAEGTKRDDISEKLKELTGDWTDEDDEEDEEEDEDHLDRNEQHGHEIEGESQQSAHVEEVEEENHAAADAAGSVDGDDDVEITKADHEEDSECEQKSTTADEDDIDLALKNLHTRESPVPEQQPQQQQQQQIDEEATTSSSYERKELDDEHKTLNIIKKEENINEDEKNTSMELEKAEKEKGDLKALEAEESLKEELLNNSLLSETEEPKAENDNDMEVDDDIEAAPGKTGNTLLDELMAEADDHLKRAEEGEEEEDDDQQVNNSNEDDDKEFINFKEEQLTIENKLNETHAKTAPIDVEKKLQKNDTDGNAVVVDIVEKENTKRVEHDRAEKTIKSLISEWAEDDDDDEDDVVDEISHHKIEKIQKPQCLEDIIEEATADAQKSSSTSLKKEKQEENVNI